MIQLDEKGAASAMIDGELEGNNLEQALAEKLMGCPCVSGQWLDAIWLVKRVVEDKLRAQGFDYLSFLLQDNQYHGVTATFMWQDDRIPGDTKLPSIQAWDPEKPEYAIARAALMVIEKLNQESN